VVAAAATAHLSDASTTHCPSASPASPTLPTAVPDLVNSLSASSLHRNSVREITRRAADAIEPTSDAHAITSTEDRRELMRHLGSRYSLTRRRAMSGDSAPEPPHAPLTLGWKDHGITFTLKRRPDHRQVEPRRLLSTSYVGLRPNGDSRRCEHGVCGACTVLIDGKAARACLCFAAQVDGRNVHHTEGLNEADDTVARLQAEMQHHHALQCASAPPASLSTLVPCSQRTRIRRAR